MAWRVKPWPGLAGRGIERTILMSFHLGRGMRHDEYARCDAMGLAELVRRGEVSPAELLDAALAAVARFNPIVNAVNRDMADDARRRVAAGLPEGPLRGVPYLLKDLLANCEGFPLGAGNRLLQSVPARRDSELVARLRRAGLVIAGRTATPELGLTPYTEPQTGGPTRNPWNPALTSGGSSGGSAAAVAIGMAPAASGGDGGGSIRIPASCCGLFGLKPSRGRNPCGPELGIPWRGLVQEHALTRSVRDSAALLDITHGADAGAPCAAPAPGGRFLDAAGRMPGRLRVTVCAQPLLGNGQPGAAARAALADAASLLASLGHQVEEGAPAIDADAALRAFFTVVACETWADIRWIAGLAGRAPRMDDVEPATWMLGLIGKSMSAEALTLACRQFDLISRQLGAFFETTDILLTPTLAIEPHPVGALQPNALEQALLRLWGRAGSARPLRWLGVVEKMAERIFAGMPYTPLFNISGQPAMSLPLFWSEAGLPVGVQCVARYGDEETLFSLAAQLEAARPWFQRRPPLAFS